MNKLAYCANTNRSNVSNKCIANMTRAEQVLYAFKKENYRTPSKLARELMFNIRSPLKTLLNWGLVYRIGRYRKKLIVYTITDKGLNHINKVICKQKTRGTI